VVRGPLGVLEALTGGPQQWRAEGDADGATAPGIHPGGIQMIQGTIFVKIIKVHVNDKKEEKNVVSGT